MDNEGKGTAVVWMRRALLGACVWVLGLLSCWNYFGRIQRCGLVGFEAIPSWLSLPPACRRSQKFSAYIQHHAYLLPCSPLWWAWAHFLKLFVPKLNTLFYGFSWPWGLIMAALKKQLREPGKEAVNLLWTTDGAECRMLHGSLRGRAHKPW